ncbi:1,4-alpha-glucan branching protein [Marinitoga sp. 1135]|uniref:1,4-alpha-glucan branching enzyme GlgB n=1 Tax=Marinitoga piezophila (strain DSM 14283 / JCM 11233 / KA3) TaxID=443254 RepID=H2J651_MARPK|nr:MULTISPECIES: 1,4-alpha-glucan branching protein GlgB [Marinitoga]AEX85112.1 alpha-1,4-glucan:alpha-1,4-glucan 6-glycosyltransferase [Marinitoga piezophila KA3]NUU95324.1 1,4-alpha-glucan branching protein [Marinitoga sp. 1135]NUU97258.1 1,4-alpha-glucan branching protein [Marinitoga sp. 1138]
MGSMLNDEMLKIVKAEHHDPFSVLGIHKLNEKEIVIRTFHPFAEKIEIINLDTKTKRKYKMEKIHPDGLFEKVLKRKTFFKYEFLYTDSIGNSWKSRDPYSFLPVLTDYDLYLFNEGNNHKIYEKLGAHPMEIDGAKGTYFAVWAPNAKRVSVVGNFNNWDGRVHQMRVLGSSGVWEIFIPLVQEGDIYKFEIKTQTGELLLKADPYATYTELRPKNASIVYDLNNKHRWNDKKWMDKRRETNWFEKPISIYEVHLGSWKKKNNDEFLNYRELAHQLVEYVKKHGYTHIEIMPVLEHPLDESWGYQVTGYFSPTSRYGTPEDFMYFVDYMHQHNIGVILDWVPGHFPKDAHGLGKFDGTALYEHMDPRLGEHPDWGTYIFNYGRNEVKNFLISNALYWLDKFHIDGLRVDAVASMLYLDFSRKEGEWIPNIYGGRENLEAIEFLKYFNSITHKYFPGILTIAEESTAWPGVSKPVDLGGLGFSMKWNMGWMNDSLRYMARDPLFRKHHQNELTFSLVYAFSENYILVLSHDEVVHGKGSMINKMPGDYWQKFANLRLFYSYMFAHPGKKLLFMGNDIAQFNEWNCKKALDWNLLEFDSHKKMLKLIDDLNRLYKENPELYEVDYSPEGFEWIDYNDAENSVISFIRKGKNPDEFIVAVFNFTPVVRYDYRIGVPKPGFYKEILNTDSEIYWGSNVGNQGGIYAEHIPFHGREYSINITLPPLAGIYFKWKKQ